MRFSRKVYEGERERKGGGGEREVGEEGGMGRGSREWREGGGREGGREEGERNPLSYLG